MQLIIRDLIYRSPLKKLESKSGFQKADFAISLLYKDDFVDLVAPVYIQEGLEWMKSYLDSNGNRNGE